MQLKFIKIIKRHNVYIRHSNGHPYKTFPSVNPGDLCWPFDVLTKPLALSHWDWEGVLQGTFIEP